MTTPVVTYVEPLQDDEERRRRSRSKGGGKGEGGENCCDGDITENPFLRTSSTTTSTSSCLTYTMAFMVPASHQGAPPTTADKRIFFERRKKMAVLVR